MDSYFTSFGRYGTNDTSTSYGMYGTVGTSTSIDTSPNSPMVEEILSTRNGSMNNGASDDEPDLPGCNKDEISVGMKFESKMELLNHVKRWHIKNGREFKISRSEPTYVVLQCKSAPINCLWRIRGHFVKELQVWKITKFDHMHNCKDKTIKPSHCKISSSFVANYVFPLVTANIGLKISTIMALVKDEFHYDISFPKAWYAKQEVLEQLFGTHEAAFPKLPRLLNALEQSNRGTVVQYQHKRIENGEATFGMVFWAFGATIEGFKHCRPLISIDSTHLYGKYRGELLVGVGYDVNNQLFPLCYALADSESNESWTFFLLCIKQYVTQEREGICLLSDYHEAIIHAVNLIFPESEGFHRFCSRHLVSNFNKEFKNSEIKDELEAMASCPSKRQFDFWYDRFCGMGIDGNYTRWIERIPKEKWALAYDDGHRFGNMTTNLVELCNGVLKGARGLPVTAIVLLTYFRTKQYFVERREQGQTFLGAGHTLPLGVQTQIDHATIMAYINSYKPRFYPLPDEMFWPAWNGPTIVGDPSRFITKSDRKKSSRNP